MSKLNREVISGIDEAVSAPVTSASTLADLARAETFAEVTSAATQEKRARRRPLDGKTEKLKVYGELPGYHLHIANDDGNRLVEMQGAGYEFVNADEIQGTNGNICSFNTDAGGRVRFVVGTNAQNEPLYGFLMKTPIEFWEEDQKTLEERNLQVDRAIRSGHYNEKPNERRYIPSTGITMDSRLYRPS